MRSRTMRLRSFCLGITISFVSRRERLSPAATFASVEGSSYRSGSMPPFASAWAFAGERPSRLGADGRHKESNIFGSVARIAHKESDPRLLGCVGRMDARQDGFVHLRARSRPRTHRTSAAFRYLSDILLHWLLRQRPVRALPDRMEAVHAVGTAGRSFRPRTNARPHHPLLLAFHIPR